MRNAGKFGDLSSGIYIYAWPVQQVTVAYLPGAHFMLLLAIFLAATTTLAWLSWHFIERPALAFKPGGAGWLAGRRSRLPKAGRAETSL